MSIVSVSRRAAPPHDGQVVARNDSVVSRGLPPPGGYTKSSGSRTGSSSSGTATMPQSALQ